MNTVNTDFRIDLELVNPEAKALVQMQQKLNQWITIGQLVKFEKDILPTGQILFTICRKKGAE